MHALVLLAVGGLLLTVGDIVFKFWVEKSQPYLSLLYVGGLALYTLGAVFLVESYKTENIAVATAIFVLINIATLALFSWFYFHEKLSMLQILGLGLAVFSIVLLELGK